MRINTNLTAMNTHTQYTKNNNNIAKAVEKLSSGYSINSAADNAAGLAISEKMRAQIRGLEQAATNSQDAISLVQTAEGGLNETTEVLQRMRELAVQSANDTNENEIDREALQNEFDQLKLEIDNIAKSTSFNKKTVLDGSLSQHRAKTANLNFASSELSVTLGNVAAGSYSFEAIVKTEKAAVEGQTASFTPISTSESISVTVPAGGINYQLGDTALPNGNYTMEASYNAETYELTVAAKGDNGQTFTAVVNKTALDNFTNETNPANKKLTLGFKNGNSTAFSFDIKFNGSFTTANAASVESFAAQLSESLSVSAAGGVDASDPEYALYATMTGGEDVKLQAGMSSVTFTNGVTVNFDELTVSDIDTANRASLNNGTDVTATDTKLKFSNFTAADDANIAAGNLTFGNTALADGKLVITATHTDGTAYTATLSEADLETLGHGKTDATATARTLEGVTFSDTNGNSFAIDMTYTSADATAVDIDAANAFATAATAVTASTWNSDTAFGSVPSTFEIEVVDGDGLTFQIGANKGDELQIYVEEMTTNYLGVASADILSRETASAALSTVDSALNQVASQRAYLGAMQNRLEHKIANLETATQNLTNAESTIRDVDMAKQMTEFTNANILSQAATAMLAQANSLPQGVLSLLQG